MTDDGPHTEAELLAIHDPRVVFGEATGDERRRRYLRLVRRFNPESHPVAFAHLRGLLERLEPPDADPTRRQADPTRATVIEQVESALLARRWDELADLVPSVEAELFETRPGLWAKAVQFALHSRWSAFDRATLTAIRARLDRAPRDEAALEAERLVDLRLAWENARLDPGVPPAVIVALGRWSAELDDPVVALEALAEVGAAVPGIEDADRLWSYVDRAHPALMVVLYALGAVVRAHVEARASPRPAGVRSAIDTRGRLRAAVGAVVVAAGLVAGVVGTLAHPIGGLPGFGLMFAAPRVQAWAISDARAWRARFARDELAGRAALEAWCRESGLFPWEIPPPERVWPPDRVEGHAGLRLAEDRGALARTVSQAHRARARS